MGGVVARYFVTLGGGDGAVHRLVTIGSPHGGTDVSRVGIGHPTRELFVGSKLVTRLAAAPTPEADARDDDPVARRCAGAGSAQAEIPGAERIVFDDLGHVAMLGSRRVAREIIIAVR